MSLLYSRHSHLVTGLKIALPLTALGVLATIFLFPREIDPTRALPYADVDVEDLTRDPRLSAPRFASVTEDGTAVTITARALRASPGGTGEWFTIEGVSAVLTGPDGERSVIAAESARLDQAAGVLFLDGAVRLSSAAGYDLQAENITIALDRTRLEGVGPVTANGPPGEITSGGVLLTILDGGDGAGEADTHVLVFTGGVNLLYQPGDRE